MRQWRTPRPLLVPVPSEAERKGPHERVCRQDAAPNARRRVRRLRRSTTGDLAEDFLCMESRPGSAWLYIIQGASRSAPTGWGFDLRAFLWFDRPGGAERLAGGVHGPYTYVRLCGFDRDHG